MLFDGHYLSCKEANLKAMHISMTKRILDYIQWHKTHWVRLEQEYRTPLFELLSLLSPQQAKGFRKIRIGADRDGGYVMLDDFKGIDLALSLGIGPDVSWDYAIAERGIPVRQFDYSISGPPQHHPLFHFEQKRVTADISADDKVALSSLLQDLAAKQLLLKIDIEGDEWSVFAQLDPKLLGSCRQILFELHDFLSIKNLEWRTKATQTLSLLMRDFGVVHVHGNNLSKHILLGDLCLPDSLEVTLANRHFYQLEPTEENFPGPHDKKITAISPTFPWAGSSFNAQKNRP